MCVGANDGSSVVVGESVVGASVGEFVGTAVVGFPVVGSIEGAPVGARVGLPVVVGFAIVGARVGASEGFPVARAGFAVVGL